MTSDYPSDAYREIVEVKEMHGRDNFDVPAVRIPLDTYSELLKQASFITAENPDMEIELENDDAVGICAGMEVIPDEEISGVVADDVILNE